MAAAQEKLDTGLDNFSRYITCFLTNCLIIFYREFGEKMDAANGTALG